MIFHPISRYVFGLLCLTVLGCTSELAVEHWPEREKFENMRPDEFGLILYPNAAGLKEGDRATWRTKGRTKDLPSGFFDFRDCEVEGAGADPHFAATVDFYNYSIIVLRSGEIVEHAAEGILTNRVFAYEDEVTAYQVREFLASNIGVDQSQVFDNLAATQKKCLVRPEQ